MRQFASKPADRRSIPGRFPSPAVPWLTWAQRTVHRRWHGVADLVIINRKSGTCYSIDYKTSKNARYADVTQLDLVACGLFAKFPEVKRIKSALMFVVSKEFIKAEHVAETKQKYIDKVLPHIERLEGAFESGVWNAKQGALCGWCPVTDCEHYVNRSRK